MWKKKAVAVDTREAQRALFVARTTSGEQGSKQEGEGASGNRFGVTCQVCCGQRTYGWLGGLERNRSLGAQTVNQDVMFQQQHNRSSTSLICRARGWLWGLVVEPCFFPHAVAGIWQRLPPAPETYLLQEE